MFDDARWGDDPRDRGDSDRGLSRGMSGHRDRNNEHAPGDLFTKELDLPRGVNVDQSASATASTDRRRRQPHASPLIRDF